MSADPLLPSFHAQDRLKRTVSRDKFRTYSVTDLDKNCFGFLFFRYSFHLQSNFRHADITGGLTLLAVNFSLIPGRRIHSIVVN